MSLLQWTAIGDYASGDRFAYQDVNAIVENIRAAEGDPRVYPLGGSRQTALSLTASGQNVLDYYDVELTGISGYTYQARVEVRAGASTAVTPKIRNITDGVDAGVGSSCSATNADYSGTNQVQTIPLTVVIGTKKKYRFMATAANGSSGVYAGMGVIERFPTSL